MFHRLRIPAGNRWFLLTQPKMNIQIDIKPIEPRVQFSSYKMITYINGSCYLSIISQSEVDRMVKEGIVNQVKGHRHEGGVLVEFDFPNKVDGAGVQFTSTVYQLLPIEN